MGFWSNQKSKFNNGDIVLILVFLVMVQVMCLWCVDISVSALINNGIVTNGFAVRDPAQTYHLGLYGVVFSTFGIIFLMMKVMYPIKSKE